MIDPTDPIEARRRELANALRTGQVENPDQLAADRRRASQLGVTVGALRLAESNGVQLPRPTADPARLAQESPKAASFLSQPGNAAVAHDDTDKLSLVEQGLSLFENIGRGLIAGIPRTNADIVGGAQAVSETGDAVADLVGSPFRALEKVFGVTYFERAREQQRADERRMLEGARKYYSASAAATRPETSNPLAQAAYSGLESVLPSLASVGASVLTGGGAGTASVLMASPVAGGAYGEARDAGKSLPEALAYAAAYGGAEAAGERIGLGPLMDGLKMGSPFLQTFVKTQISEQLGEQVTTVLQDFTDYAMMNPDETFGDYLAARPEAALHTAIATAVGTGATTTTAYAVNKGVQALAARDARNQRAESTAQMLEQINAVAAASKLREREPETFEAFVEELTADGPVDTLYIDAEVFNQSLADKGYDVEQVKAALPAVAEQLDAALASGGDLAIPISQFAAYVPGTELAQPLIDNARADPSLPSRAEVKALGDEASEQIRAEVEKVLTSEITTDEFRQSSERMKASLLEQLNTAGRFTKDVNEAYASLPAAYYTVRAAQLGITPEEMARRFPLQIEAELPTATPARALDQQGPETQRDRRNRPNAQTALATASLGLPTQNLVRGTDGQLYLTFPDDGYYAANGVVGQRWAERAQDVQRVMGEPVTPTVANDARLEGAEELILSRPPVNENGKIELQHFSAAPNLTASDPATWGQNPLTSPRERARVGQAPARTYFGIASGEAGGYKIEFGSASAEYTAEIDADRLYDAGANPDGLDRADHNAFETAVRDAGYAGYWTKNRELGMAAAVFEPLELRRADTNQDRFSPLVGAPSRVKVGEQRLEVGPFAPAREAAHRYMEARGLQYAPPVEYAKIDGGRAARLADAFDRMQHAPDDPLVRSSYRAMIEETLAQYQFVKATGLEISLMVDGMEDPYAASPRLSTEDVRNNNHLWVYPTDFGFGGPSAAEIDISGNPLLEWTDEYIGDKRLRANDVFRIVHDYFGHVKDGTGFRADGEENAWQSHAAMFTPLARRAMTTETRGQNSWVNFGPYGDKNRTASAGETEYAPQKIGLLPEWASSEGFLGGANTGLPVGETREPSAYTLYRGEGGDSGGGNYFSFDREFARNFTRAGRDEEIRTVGVSPADVYEADVLPLATKEEQIDRAIAEAREAGKKAIRVDEGAGEPNSVFVFDKTAISDPATYNQETPVATNTPEFKAWFGDSKAVDENGDPLVVYHGTNAEFDAFDPDFFGEAYDQGEEGFFFTSSEDEADKWAALAPNAGNPITMPVYLRAQRPWIVEVPDGRSPVAYFESGEGVFNRGTATTLWYAEESGYDALIVKGETETMYVVFDPTQIKSVNNRGTFDPNDPVIYNQSDAPTNPPFFSALKRAVEESKTAKAPAAQWKATLAKTPGVKAEELEWTGLNEWLDLQEGSIDRAAIVDYLDAGGIQLEEVALGEGEGSPELERELTAQFESEHHYDAITDFEESGLSEYRVDEGENENGDTVWQVLRSDEEFDPESDDSYESQDDAYGALTEYQREEAEDYASASVDNNRYEIEQRVEEALSEQEGNAQYRDYKLPGANETYREFLLKLPVIRSNRFRSSEGHFDDQDDVIAHARFTTREDAEGRRILFLEEVQSTHHETGREQGYIGNVPPEEVDRLYAAVGAAQEARDAWLGDNRDAIVGAVENAVELLRAEREAAEEKSPRRRSIGETLSYMEMRLEVAREAGLPRYRLNELLSLVRNASRRELPGKKLPMVARMLLADEDDLLLRSREAQNAYNAATEGVEPAPWTKSWSQLVMKRMIRYAADNGLDGVAWINGNQQNGGQTGGDGAWFYERNLVNETNTILKKLGSRVEKIDMRDAATRSRFPDATPLSQEERAEFEARRDEMAEAAGEGDFARAEQLKEALAGLSARVSAEDFNRPEGGLGLQNGFYLTDKIKEQAAQGFALFQRNRGQIAFGQDITQTPSVISLLRTADLSTFLHETGHFFLEVDAYIANQPDAPEQIKADFQKLLDWFGVPDLAAWNAMGLEEKRVYHEQFARGFEAYLFEGRAPTQEMRPLFQRFSSWLKAAYRQLISNLNVELTDEVRSVMDRMVVSQDAIAEREAELDFRPIADSRPNFMTEQEWSAYQRNFAGATTEAESELDSRLVRDMQWASKARSRALKRLQAQANTQRRIVLAEVTGEVREEPVYRAMRFLSHGTDYEGDPLPGAGKLDLSALREMYGEAPDALWQNLPRRGRYGVAGNNGLHPDAVAETFGFSSGDALVRALLAAEDINQKIAGLTDQRMLERFGDIADPQDLEKAADEAVANNVRLRVLATEFAALAKATGQPRALASAAKEAAEEIVNRMPLRRLKAPQFFAAATRAGRKADEAMRKGDLQTAAAQKRNQLVNMYAARAVLDAKAEVDKAMSLYTRIATAKAENLSKSRDLALVNAARAILARYGLGRAKNRPDEYIELVKAYDPSLFQDISAFLATGPADAKPFDLMSVEEFKGLNEVVRQLWALSRRTMQVEIEGKLIDLEQARTELGNRLDELGYPDNAAGRARAPTDTEKAARGLQGVRASLRRVEGWARGIDGADHGPFQRLIFRPISKAADRYRAESAQYMQRFLELIRPIEADLAKTTKISAPEIGYTFNSKAELLHAILHRGNQSNLSKLLLGRQWGEKNPDGSLNTDRWDAFVDRMHKEGVLGKAHYDFAQSVWNLLNDTKPGAQQAHRAIYGRYFDEVAADAFETPWGTYEGGYVPATTDQFMVQDAALRAEQQAIEDSNSSMFPAASNGFTKSRVEDYTKELALDVRLLPMHIDKVLKFTHLGPPVRDVARILKGRAFSDKLQAFDPVAQSDLLLPWLQRSAKQIVQTPTTGAGGKLADTFFRELRSRTGMQIMFANLSNVAQQVTGVATLKLRVKQSHLNAALWKYARGPGQMAQDVTMLSAFMATRTNSQIFEARQTIEQLLLNPSKYEKLRDFSSRHAYFFQMAAQNITDIVGWAAAYDQAVARGDTDADAISFADSVVRETQSSMAPEDVSRAETGTPLTRLFMQFYSFFNTLANLNATEIQIVARGVGLRKGAGRLFYIYLMGFAAQALIGDAIAQAFRGGWDDDEDDGYLDEALTWFFGGQAKFALAMVPGVGMVTNAAFGAFTPEPYDDRVSVSPAVSSVESSVRVPAAVYDSIVNGESFNRRDVRDTFTLLGMMTGTPAGVLGRPAGYLTGVAQGEIEPTGPLDFTRGLATGNPSPESRTN